MANTYEHVRLHEAGDVVVLTILLARVSDYDRAQAMGQEMLDAIQGTQAPKVAINLRNVTYMSSVGYLPFINLRVAVRDAGGRLVLCGMSPVVKEMFETTRLLINPRSPASLFEFSDSLEGAVALLQS